jgi:hypothetical protein
VKKNNSVFNNFNSTNKYDTNAKKNYSSRNGFVDSQNEFAEEFFEDKNVEVQNERRQKNTTKKPEPTHNDVKTPSTSNNVQR